jgi:rsbT antagonist protein RsbS
MRHHTAIPIIRLRRNLLVSIQVELSDQLVDRLKADVSEVIRESDVRGLVIEVSGVDVFDSYIARSIRDLARIAHLLGVTTVLAGLDPGMAMTLVEMAMTMDGLHTALDLSDALAWLERDEQERDQVAGELLDALDAPSPSASAGLDD